MAVKLSADMKQWIFVFCMALVFPFCTKAQQIVFSEPYQDDAMTMNFEILGKLNGNILVFKNVRWRYAINIYNDSMLLKEKVELEYLPGKTFNIDFIVYPDYMWLIYQYQKKGILYCMAQKLDAMGKKVNEALELDTTQIGSLGDNKIYSTIWSDDKKQIMVFKMQRKDDRANFVTKLFNNQLQLQHSSRVSMDYDDRKFTFGDFFVDNSGNFIFSNTIRNNVRENASVLTFITKAPFDDIFRVVKSPFRDAYLDEVKMKIDNLNKRYVFTSFYYKEVGNTINGLYNFIWDAAADTVYANVYTEFSEELKAIAKSSGNDKNAFNDFFIRNIVLKKDGSYILTAEDQASQTSGINNWNRYDYLYSSPYFSSYDYYMYTPSYYGFYRPFSTFGNQGIRYYYDNILILSITKNGIPEWTNILHKQQFSDDNDNYLSYSTFNTSGEIHFLFNDISKRDKQLLDNIVKPGGTINRNPSLRTYENGYEFMPRFAKQVAARQVIVPCTYRGLICFAKVDF